MSLPSSQTDIDQSALVGSKGEGGSITKQPVHHSRIVETLQMRMANQCSICDEDLTCAKCVDAVRRTNISIMFEKVIEHRRPGQNVPNLSATVEAKFPSGFISYRSRCP